MEKKTPQNSVDGFDSLIDEIRSRLLPVLVAKWGIEVGSDLCSDVEEYAWENRVKMARMENPLGYLYRVAQSKSRSHVRWMKRTTFPSRFPDIVHEDPALVHAFGWTYEEVAELLGVTRAVVNHNVHRGLTTLRSSSLNERSLSSSHDSTTMEHPL